MTVSTPRPADKAATPLMQQYLGIKQRYPEEILFFRLGDFYEMFFEDAIKAAPLLEVALTQRQQIPMCGIPHHAMTAYLSKLIKAGVSVALAEQLEDPKKTKGMVKRDVVRVITPGTLVEDELLPSKANNFLAAIAVVNGAKKGTMHWALAAADVSTGRQWVGELENDFQWNTLKAHLAGLAPSEILLVGDASKALQNLNVGRAVVRLDPSLPGDVSPSTQAVGAIRRYLERDHAGAVKSLRAPEALPLAAGKTLFLDETAIRHLELVNSADPLKPGPTLISVIDHSVTPLGSRLLRWWLLHPSLELDVINGRLHHVEDLVENSPLRSELRELLASVADLERICVRSQAGTVSPRDLEALRGSLGQIPKIQELLAPGRHSDVPLDNEINAGTYSKRYESRNPVSQSSFEMQVRNLDPGFRRGDLEDILSTQLADEPSAKLIDGGVIRDGFNADLDELRGLRRNGKKWIAEMEAEERQRTGIGSLKVGYNDIFGYFIEVSKTNLSKVPAEWIRKQTMANGERYITPALKEQEEKILGAEEKIHTLEIGLYNELVHQVAAFAPSLGGISETIAYLDAVASLAQAAVQQGFIRPTVNDSGEFSIKGGRHPTVERQIGRDRFIANDVQLTDDTKRIAIITGPNMAGKSTYLRQNALITILAQMGSFVPAESATIGLVDKIFTRIGASDRLAQGQSTFMVEMQEVATLLQNATGKSLLILDEVGRGTSTYDGVSIAWAVIEYLAQLRIADRGLQIEKNPQSEIRNPKSTCPRTLFATHYFELTQLEGRLPGVFNAHATAKEWPGPDGRRQVVFLYQILPGAADRSYGIHVAEMAGLPVDCIERARGILQQLEAGGHGLKKGAAAPATSQLELFSEHPVVSELKNLHVEAMTPIEALNKLSELKEKI